MAMTEHTFETECGIIHYWVNDFAPDRYTLVFLPGLTAGHELFDHQVEHFAPTCNCLVWDAPAHGQSRPFSLDFNIDDKAKWLHGILQREHVEHPVLVGQSMGGYVSQMYIELFSGSAAGFISIDSPSLKRRYVSSFELWLLKRTEPMYRAIPWELLLKWGAHGTAQTTHGRKSISKMWECYSKDEYCKLAGHGFGILANAYESERDFDIDCPALLLVGTKDQAGASKRLCRRWAEDEGLPLVWLEGAGHNSNDDAFEETNALIEEFLKTLPPIED